MNVCCQSCQADNPDTNRFCGQCGSALEKICGQCGSENPPTSNFCGQCGSKLANTNPNHSDLLSSRAVTEGERKLVTVLFADISGSTELVQHLDPENAAELLRPAMEAMHAAVHTYEGTVNKIQGDGIMALFGAPIAYEDHAIRAALAALEMQEAIAGIGQPELIARVGLNTGEVLVRSIDNDFSVDYDATGQTVHLAARMEQMADPGTVLMTPATLRLAAGAIEVQSLGPKAVKGVAQPVELFQLVGRSSVSSSWLLRSARGLSRFVGRQKELRILSECLDQNSNGRGALAAIIGEPGQGKSRLVHEFSQLALSRGYSVLRAETTPTGTSTPYLPFNKLLRSIFAVEEHDSQAQIAEGVADAINALDENLTSTIPALQSVVDIPVVDQTWRDLDPQLRRRRIIDGIKSLSLARARAAPSVLIFEDLHWIDSESQAVLDALVDAIAAARITIVVTYRPEYQHNWMNKSYYSRVRLNPLDQGFAAQLLDDLIGISAESADLKGVLIERTEGNPLFLEETVRNLIETGYLQGERGRYRTERSIEALRVPPTIQSVIAARIDRLTSPLKDLLQTASVVGRTVPLRLLLPLSATSDDAIREKMAELVAAEFFYETSTPLEVAFTFKHALTELVAYEGLLKERRRSLHKRLVDIIEKEYAGRIEEHLEELAHHASEAGDWERAYHYNLLAARKSHSRSAYGQAITFFEAASSALDELPNDDNSNNKKIDVRLEMRIALWPLGDHEKLVQRATEALGLAEAAGKTIRLANAHSYLTAHYWQAGQHDAGIEHGLEAIRLAKDADDFSARVTSQQHLGLAYLAKGEYEAATDLLREVAEALTGPPALQRHGMAGYPAALSRGFLAWGLSELGARDEAFKRAAEALELAGRVNSVMTRVWVTDDVAITYLRFGRIEQAVELMKENLRVCRESEVWLLASLTASVFGYALALQGDLDEALPLLEEAIEPSVRRMCPEGSGFPFVWLAEGYLKAGRMDDAIAAGDRALEIATGQGEAGHRAWALRLIGRVEAERRDDLDKARHYLEQAKSIATERLMAPLIATCVTDIELIDTLPN
jgi:class 3 adenylate cyclase/tetratricopeptide (TPR) repeat protein/ribosomal protein L40E